MNRVLLNNPRLLRPFGTMANDFEQLVERFFNDSGEGGEPMFTPRLDLAELEDRYEVTVDLPGVKPEDVRVEMHEDRLTISGNRESVSEEKGRQYHRIERSSGSFSRTIVLPATIDADKISASCDHGLLKVELPKAAANQPRRIKVSGAANQIENGQAAGSVPSSN